MPITHAMWILASLVMVGVVVLIVVAVLASNRTVAPIGASPMPMGARPPQPASETPLEILARRFASGEINADEYERARDLLGGSPKT